MMDHKHIYPIEKMSKVLNVSRSSFYNWSSNPPSNNQKDNDLIMNEIRIIHKKSKHTYGSPRITAELIEAGFKVSRPRVARLMRKAGVRSIVKKKYKVTTNSNHKYPVAENLLDRNFSPGEIGKVWVSDITYLRTLAGWAYLTTIIDLGDRKVIGWTINKSLRAEGTAIAAWKMAVKNRPIEQSLIFHSDRGVQYACNEFTNLISTNKLVTQSMSRKGNCWDNAVAESFFKTLKSEWSNRFVYKNHHQVELSMFEYIESYYNTQRRHSALGYLSPADYSTNLFINKNAA